MAPLLELPAVLAKSPSFQIESVHRHTKNEVERALAEENTTIREYWILSCVTAQPCSQTQLATLLAIDASDMVRLIDSLEGHGWVTRDRDPKDRRRQIVTPTKKGTKAHAELAARVAAAEERALDASSQKQLKSLKKLSRAILGDAE